MYWHLTVGLMGRTRRSYGWAERVPPKLSREKIPVISISHLLIALVVHVSSERLQVVVPRTRGCNVYGIRDINKLGDVTYVLLGFEM